MSKLTLVKMPEGHLEIHNEQGALYCPFQNKIPIQQNNGSMMLIPIPCTSGCPHFNYLEREKNNGIKLTCGNGAVLKTSEYREQKLHTTPFAKA